MAGGGRLGAGWRRFWARAPRRLRATTAGRLLLGLTLATGLLALSSGNNLLFFVWGMQLGAILLSGLLSEATLRPLRLQAQTLVDARVGQPAYVQLQLHNAARLWPVYAVQLAVRLRPPAARLPHQAQQEGRLLAHAPFLLRLAAGARASRHATFVPTRRGPHRLQALVAQTAWPFGLFRKDRRFAGPTAALLVWPAQVQVDALLATVTQLVGEMAAARAGDGDDFFALRPYRAGDPPARVAWRRAAAGRPLVVREQEATRGAQVTLLLALDATRLGAPAPVAGFADLGEYTLAVVASLGEALLARGWRLGLRTHGLALAADDAAAGGARRRRTALLDGLAALPLVSQAGAFLPALPAPTGAAGGTLQRATLVLVGLAATAEPARVGVGEAWPQLDLAQAGGLAP